MKSIWAIIPAYNEAERIAQTVKAVQMVPEIEHILVVNDGSTDSTAEEAMKTGAQLLNLPEMCIRDREFGSCSMKRAVSES